MCVVFSSTYHTYGWSATEVNLSKEHINRLDIEQLQALNQVFKLEVVTKEVD